MNTSTSTSRATWSSDELTSQLHTIDSILDLAAQFNLTSSPSATADPLSSSPSRQQLRQHETPPTQQEQNPRSIIVADLILDIERTQRQLSQMESQLRNIKKLQLAQGFSSHSINDRIRCLDTFSNQILLLHQNQAQLLDRLSRNSSSPASSLSSSSHYSHQPRQGVIMMDPQYHRDFVDLFYQIQDEIPKIDGHLKALLGWNQQQKQQQGSALIERVSSSSASLTLSSGGSQNASIMDRLKTSLDGLTGLSQQQLEILEASSKLQTTLIKVLQSSSSSSSSTKNMTK